LKRKIAISIIISLLFFSCNYIPFPCNFKPDTDSFKIDPIERDDDDGGFEILRDTIISSSENHYVNDNELAATDLNFLPTRKPVYMYRNVKSKNENDNRRVYTKTIVKHTTNTAGEKVIETKNITFTIEHLECPSLQDTPEIVKAKKQLQITIAVSKQQGQS
jgi:hypothetical protein